MGLLNLFAKPQTGLLTLPTGSFTVSREGSIVVGTIPSTYPTSELQAIAECVLAAFRGAARAQLPFSELIICYASFRITARELRGGAVVFLTPDSSRATHDQK